MMSSTLASFASSSFTPKLNNLSKKKHDTVMTWDPWDLSSPSSISDDSNPFSFKEEDDEVATTVKKKPSFEDLMAGVDSLERSLSMRHVNEMDLSERLGKLASEDMALDTIEEEETESAVGGAAHGRLCLVEELKRRVKEASDRISAKDDACDLIYSQWQKTQADLDEKTKSEAALLIRLEHLEDAIDDLQFRLFMAESELEEKREEKKETLAQHTVQSPVVKKENVAKGPTGNGTPLGAAKSAKSDSALVPRRLDRVLVKQIDGSENPPKITSSPKTQPEQSLVKKAQVKKGPSRGRLFFGFGSKKTKKNRDSSARSENGGGSKSSF